MRKGRLGKILALILTASVLCACGAEQTSTDQTKEEDSAASAGNAQESETAVSENTADQQTASGKIKINIYSVSYTHLDVYKRQIPALRNLPWI